MPRFGRLALSMLMLAAAVLPAPRAARVVNRSAEVLWIRPEIGDRLISVPPGGRHRQLDALALPQIRPGLIYRATNHCTVIVDRGGTPLPFCQGLAAGMVQWMRGGWKSEAWNREQIRNRDLSWDLLFRASSRP